jgi:hypothetical protein
MLQVHATGGEDERSKKQQERDQMYILNDPDASAAGPSSEPAAAEQVLVFEFNDGELKGKGGKVIHHKSFAA